MIPLTGKRILFWDLETAGVDGLSADRGFVVCFGYKWAGEKKAQCISILDHPGENCQDDTELLKAALNIMEKAELLVAHYGEKFDRKFLESRLLRARLRPIPMTRLADTCLISRNRLKLSSNRLGNLAEFLGVKTGKMEKRGGWPAWWMGALRGDIESIKKMSVYCAQDVQCLEECFNAMKHIISNRYLLNRHILTGQFVCPACAGTKLQSRGFYFSESNKYRQFQCTSCGKWIRSRLSV